MFTVGRLVGSCSPATDNDGHATKRPSTFFEHRRRLIQPTRKPTDLTNPSTDRIRSTFRHGRVFGAPMGEPKFPYYAEWEFPDRDAFKAAARTDEFMATGKDAMEMGVPFHVHFADVE